MGHSRASIWANPRYRNQTLEAYLHNAILGTPAECLARIEEMETWGINYLRLTFPSLEHQTQFAESLLPLVAAREPARGPGAAS